jgi:hypothetical protein
VDFTITAILLRSSQRAPLRVRVGHGDRLLSPGTFSPDRPVVSFPRMRAVLLLLALAVPLRSWQEPEKQVIVSISGPDLRGGIISEVTWDGDALLLQGVFAQPGGELSAHYFVVPARGVTLLKRDEQTPETLKYWQMKASRVSPTGLGRITSKSDTKMPQFGIGDLERRLGDAHDMGGTQTRSTLRLGNLVLLEREGPEPYDGETWSWSPLELNQIAYVDGKADLWIADASGRRARRVLKGDYTLPAWSPDGRSIAVAERKDRGQRWEISVIRLPAALR